MIEYYINKNKYLMDSKINISFKCYLIYDGCLIKELNNKDPITKLILKRKKKYEAICKGILIFEDFNNCIFDYNNFTFSCTTTIESLKDIIFNNKKEILLSDINEELYNFYGSAISQKEYIGERGPDSWMEGDNIILDENENFINNKCYELGITVYKCQ
jgi:hypothetical protein